MEPGYARSSEILGEEADDVSVTTRERLTTTQVHDQATTVGVRRHDGLVILSIAAVTGSVRKWDCVRLSPGQAAYVAELLLKAAEG